MKQPLFLVILCLITQVARSQTPFCGSDWVPADPAVQPLHEQLEQQAFDFFKAHAQPLPDVSNPVLTIPVVVHIIHDNGPENISDAQVQLAISWLNDAYANTGFYEQGSGTNVGIQFCLAQRTPGGTATNGITRDQNALTIMTQETQDLAVKNLNRWEPKKYLNIWLVREICSTSAGCGVVGYAYRPEYHGTNRDGLLIEAQFFGAVQSQMSVAAHEIGHYLGLYHTFEGGCTNGNCLTDGDRICDTPPDQSLAAVACGQTVNTCSTDAQSGFSSDQPDMTSNFLDYGNINCFHDFTPGQGARMVFYLNGVRHSLLDSKGCLPPCANPVVNSFFPNASTIIPGQTVSFTNTSQNAGAYQWSVNGVVFSTAANPTYTFTAPGTYTVTLLAQATNAASCDPASSQAVIQVVCGVVADFSVSNDNPAENEVITLTNTSQNASSFSWTVNGVVQGPTLPTISFAEAGVYTIGLTAGDGGCQASTQLQVFVRDSCADQTFQMQFGTAEEQSNAGVVSMAALADGSTIMVSAGYKDSVGFQYGFYLTKLKQDGSIAWTRTIDTSAFSGYGYGYCYGVAAAPEAGFALALSGNAQASCYVAKLNALGTPEWIRGLLAPASTTLFDIQVNAAGEVLALGYVESTTLKGPVFAKFDPLGNLLWARRYTSPVSGEHWDKIAALPDGGLIGIGNQDNTGLAEAVRLDADGAVVWRKKIYLTAGGRFQDVAVHGNDIYIAGNGYNASIWLFKMNMDAQINWSKKYNALEAFTDIHRMIWCDAGLIIVGRAVLDPFIIPTKWQAFAALFDTAGTLLWNRSYSVDTTGVFQDVTALPTGYLVGGSTTFDNIYHTAGWLLKTDAYGFAGTCPAASLPLEMAEVPVNQQSQSFPEQSPLTAVSAVFSTIPVSLIPTLLCERSCPTNLEICNNNLDDDGDGLFDCLDPDCPCTADKCSPKRNNYWYFGNRMGLDFSTEPPTPLSDGQSLGFEATATISDDQGNLLFYTDGAHIFNRFHQWMPLGTNPNATWDQTKITCIIIPHPGNSALYYVFINDQQFSFVYALVDMRLDNGRGDVVSTAHFQYMVSSSTTVLGLAATRSCTFDGYWLATQNSSGKKWLTYRIDQNGLNLTPVMSPTGDITPLATEQIKFSPTGKLLARLIPGDSVVLYDFEIYISQAGQFSNPRKFKLGQSVQNTQALEFSPTGHYLYVSTLPLNATANVIYQFDLDAGSPGAVAGSRVEIAKSDLLSGFSALQLAPNGKIFVAHGGPLFRWIDIIQQPESPGLACQFQIAALTPVLPNQFFVSFSNCVATDFRRPYVAFPQDAPDTICQLNTLVPYRINNVHCDVDSIQWTITGPAVVVVESYQNSFVKYLAPGQCQLIVQAFTACGSAADTLDISVLAPNDKTLDLGPDRTVCDNGIFTFNAGSGFASYRWQNGSPDSVLTTLLPGKYWVDVFDGCGNRQTDTVVVKIAPNSTLSLGADLQQCAGQAVSFQRPAAFTSWQWSPGLHLNCDTCATVEADPTTTTTWTVLAQTAAGCLSLDTLHWTIEDTLFYSRDTAICVNQTLDIYGIRLPADTTARFLRPNIGPGCDTLLTLQVLGLETFTASIQTRICAGDSIRIYNTFLKPDTTAVFYRPGPGCDTLVTVEVKSYPPLTISLPADTSIFVGASLLLPVQVQGSGVLIYGWQPDIGLSCADCPQPVAGPQLSTTYRVQVQDENDCIANDSIQLRVNPECRLTIPNAFTPNGDGVNDWFYPLTDPCVRTVRLWRVFNRWGQQVFERRGFAPNQENLGWDGQVDGKAAPSDVLVWTAELEYYDGRVEQRQGEVTLLR